MDSLSLVNLPVFILEDIIAIVLELSDTPDLWSIFNGVAPYSRYRNSVYKYSIWGLLLGSHQLHAVTTHVLYSRAMFEVSSPSQLAHFLDAIGPTNLQTIRYITLNFDSDRTDHPHGDNEILRKWIDLIDRLPERLRGLRLSFPESHCLRIVTDHGTHPPLRAAVQRFHHLEKLGLLRFDMGEDEHVPWDIFSLSDITKGNTSFTTPFPILQELLIFGALKDQISNFHISDAFSQKCLPAFKRFHFIEPYLGGSLFGEGWRKFSKEILLKIQPLTEFLFSTSEFNGEEKMLYFTNGDLGALTSRHSQTLRYLTLNINLSLSQTPGGCTITEEGIAELILSSPNLKHFELHAPFLDVNHLFDIIAVCGSGHNELPRNLQVLDLHLRFCENRLVRSIKSGNVGRVLSSERTRKLHKFKLELSTKETLHSECLPQRFKRPEIKQMLVDCLEMRVAGTDMFKRGKWYEVSVTDGSITDYISS